MKKSSTWILLVSASLLLPPSVSAQVFTGSDVGAIPDGGANGPGAYVSALNVTFNVSGLTVPIGSLSLSITLAHHYLGDLDVVLIPPTGSEGSPFTIFSAVGQQVNFGFNTPGSPGTFGDFDGTPYTYVFSDTASGNLWSTAGFDTSTGTADFVNVFDIPAGSYRTSGAGPWDVSGNPNGGNHSAGQFTTFANDSGFVGLTPSQANGTWTLQIRDGNLFDTGTVTAAELSIVTVPEPSEFALLAGVSLLVFAGYRRVFAGS